MKTKILMKLHLWTSLILGLQLLLWSLSGLYFSLWGHQALMAHQHFQQVDYRQSVPQPTAIRDLPELSAPLLRQALVPRGTRWQWRLTTTDGSYYLDAATLKPWQTSFSEARQLAKASYRGDAEITYVHFYPNGHHDLIGRTDAMYEIAFKDQLSTRAYVSAQTGDVLTHRNKYWRLHDWMFRLHFMDYSGQRDFNNSLIVLFAAGTLWLILTGILVTVRVQGNLMKRAR